MYPIGYVLASDNGARFLSSWSGQTPVLRRFGDVGWLDVGAVGKVGDAAGDAQDAVQGAG